MNIKSTGCVTNLLRKTLYGICIIVLMYIALFLVLGLNKLIAEEILR